MSKLRLSFTPSCEYQELRELTAVSALPTVPFAVKVNKDLFHRRVYLWHTRTSGAFTFVGRFYASLRGTKVFSMPYVIGNTANNNYLQIGNLGVSAPNTIDMIRVVINTTSQLLIPYNFVCCCDEIGVEASVTAAAGGQGISFLGVFSQNYW